MSINIQNTFTAKEIRDTNSYNGDIIFNDDFVVKTIIIENILNQIVTLQCQGSAELDFSNSFNIGDSFDVAANTTIYKNYDNYFPYYRVTAICSSSPTSGDLIVKTYGLSHM